MDVHRCRFIPYPPSAINALAFSHASGPVNREHPLRLAVGRANGDIEIWDPHQGAWIQERTFRGGKDRSIDGIAWIRDPDEEDGSGVKIHGRLRLFSIGSSPAVTEWSLVEGVPLRQSSGSHSEIWCLAAQPPLQSRQTGEDEDGDGEYRGQHLVAGCADGTLVLLSTDNNDLTFKSYIGRATKKNARALSLAFQDRYNVVAGYADSTIRVYDVRNGSLIRTMSLGAGPRGGPKETLVWSIDCLRDGTIVSGDSTGAVCFWDAKTYGQLQRITGHEADTLCVVGSEDGQTVFSGGMDRQTVVYKLTSGDSKRRRWVEVAHRRIHKHDVKAMARFENSKMSFVVSGGLDTQLGITPLRAFQAENHRLLPFTPQTAPLSGARRRVLGFWDREVAVWEVAERSLVDSPSTQPEYKMVARIVLQGEENVTSAVISNSGDIVAVSTSAAVKVFALRTKGGQMAKINKLRTPETFAKAGAQLLEFSPDNKWLLTISRSDRVSLTPVQQLLEASDQRSLGPGLISLRRQKRKNTTQNCLNGYWGSYGQTITRATFSSDSKILVVADLTGYIDSWVLDDREDSTALGIDQRSRSSSLASASSTASDSDDDSSNEASRGQNTVIRGQRWLSNPTSRLLPRLPSHALILSFRPEMNAAPANTPNGDSATDTILHNGNVHSHPLLREEDRLLVLTASHELLEFHVLKGTLTDWSQRNPPTSLPSEFKIQRDRAIGCFWDMAGSRAQRAWLYGATWLSMFDMMQDLPHHEQKTLTGSDMANGSSLVVSDQQVATRKRKRDKQRNASSEDRAHRQLAYKHQTTGAGSRIPDHKTDGTLRDRDVKRLNAEGDVVGIGSTMQNTSAGRRDHLSEEDESASSSDDNDEDGDDELAQSSIPNGVQAEKVGATPYLTNGAQNHGGPAFDSASEGGENTAANGQSRGLVKSSEPSNSASLTPFHLTTRYRPILGIVPLTRASHDGGERPLEVALVERPQWDLDLPPSFVGTKEREK